MKKTIEIVEQGLARRHRFERLFRGMGLLAIAVSLAFLALLFFSIASRGMGALWQSAIKLDIDLNQADVAADPATADYHGLIKKALRHAFPEVKSRRDKRALYGLISNGAEFELRDQVLAQPQRVGSTTAFWLTADDDVDMLVKGHIDRTTPQEGRRLSDMVIGWLDELERQGRLKKRLNRDFFSNGDSREPELAGIRGAAIGSFSTLLVTLVLSFPLGVAAALYLEEFAPRNRWTDMIEVNINNLAAVPSIIFGLLGLAMFINFFGLPRSAPLVGGLVLSLMTLPTIIIASRAALKAVPPSIREAALGIGASHSQMVFHHVLPLALPGMFTGTIIGMAQALGETAPLLMIGMVAFIADIPGSLTDPAAVLPVQIYLWADSPERAFVEKTSAAIMVLLLFLVCMNGAAVYLRKKFERRW